MESTTHNIDLIDDIWINVFISLDCSLRARLFQVCKRWQSILSHPCCWTTLDVRFGPQQLGLSHNASLSQFILKYCKLASKVNIELKYDEDWKLLFCSLFELPNLRYLRFLLGATNLGTPTLTSETHASYGTPNWLNLDYLNFGSLSSVHIDPRYLESIFEGAPNIKELYLHHNVSLMAEGFSPSIFKRLHRLKFLSITKTLVLPPRNSPKRPLSQASSDAAINEIHSLQILFVKDTAPLTRLSSATPIMHQNNALEFSLSILAARRLDDLKKFGPLLKRSNYANFFVYVSLQQQMPWDVNTMYYLFDELGLDINCTTADKSNPFVADIFPTTSTHEACPLSSVIQDADEVQQMLDFGADPNMAYPDMSPLALPDLTKDSCLLLLEHGLDPLKKVKGRAAVAHLLSSRVADKDVAAIMRAIIAKGFDTNLIVDHETTILDIAIECEIIETALVLIAHGAQWTARAMDHLITCDRQWWKEVISGGAFDVHNLSLSTVLRAVKLGLYDQVRDYLAHRSKEIDVHGYSLVHYLAALSLLSSLPIKKAKDRTAYVPKIPVGLLPSSAPMPSAAKYRIPPKLPPPAVRVQRDMNNQPPKIPQWRNPPFAVKGQREMNNEPNVNSELTSNSETSNAEGKITLDTTKIDALSLLRQLIKELNLDVNTKSTKGQTPLLLVCKNATDDASTVTTLIECGAHVNEADENGWTPLHAAMFLRKHNTVKVLLSHGANINAQDKCGVTPPMALFHFSNTSTSRLAQIILNNNVDFTLTDKYTSRSLLHYLATRGNFLRILLEKLPGLDINCRDAHGFTPLHYAAMAMQLDSTDAMKLLVSYGANTNAVSHTLKLTPMAVLLAVEGVTSPYHRYITSYLPKEDTFVVESVSLGFAHNPLEIIVAHLPPWCSDGPVRTKSSSSFSNQSLSYIPLPFDLLIKDRFGNNCLHHIVQSKLVSTLFTSSSFPKELHQLWSTPNQYGATPFHLFVHQHHTKSFNVLGLSARSDDIMFVDLLEKILRQHGHHVIDSLNYRDEHNRTGLDYLLQKPTCWLRIQRSLFKLADGIKFASPVIIEEHSSLIHSMIKNDILDTELLDKIADSDPDSLNQKVNGKTPLILFLSAKLFTHTMSMDGNFTNEIKLAQLRSWINLFDRFMALKVDLNAQDNHGNTALHYACFFFHLGGWSHHSLDDSHLFSLVLFKLLDAGARVDIANTSGQTALNIIPNLNELDRSLVDRVKVRSNDKPVSSNMNCSLNQYLNSK